MNSPFTVGIFDLCRIGAAAKPEDAIWETINCVSKVEALGYSRYWLGEHHTHDVAHSSPDLLIPIVAGSTERIRVGATVLFQYRRPLRLANDFRLLETIFPNRIDLGIARGGAPPIISEHLLGPNEKPVYEDKILELLDILRGRGPVTATPKNISPPEVWLLGRENRSMTIASKHGTAFCLALFLNPPSAPPSADILETYRRSFVSAIGMPEPKWSVAVAGVCAQTEELARKLAGEVSGVFPSVIGNPSQCYEAFENLKTTYRTDHFVFLDVCEQFEDRMNSYSLLADELGLG